MLSKLADMLKKPQEMSFFTYALFGAVLIALLYFSASSRYAQLKTWQSYPAVFYATGTPMMTTLDAYKFLRHAKEFSAGTFDPSKDDPMIFYPDGSPYPDPVPLLSVTLDFVSKISGADIYNVGTYIIPLLSTLFIIPLAFYFLTGGYPAAGILAGLIGTFAPMYYGRSSMGRLDTDGMNLFFLITASLFILLASRAGKSWKTFLYSSLSGLTIGVFYWWYHHGMFNIFYFIVLAASLFFARVNLKNIIVALALFVLFSNPVYMANAFGQLYHAINVYIFPVKETGETVFPNVYNTIGEAQKNSVLESLTMAARNPYVAIVGIVCCVAFTFSNFRLLLPLAPFAALGAMTFVSAGRFSMFLGPIVGAGLGYALTVSAGYLREYYAKYKKAGKRRDVRIAAAAATLFLAFCLVSAFSVTENAWGAFRTVPGPSIRPPTYQMFKDMKNALPPDSAVYTWWDYGLAIADATGFPVFHSGMTQESPKTWIIAKSLTGGQKTLYNMASYLDVYGISEVRKMAGKRIPAEKIAERIENYEGGPENDADYVLLTEDLVGKYSPISYLATWNPETGKASPQYLTGLRCTDIKNNVLLCDKIRIDLDTGVINGRAAVKEIIFTEDGRVSGKRQYGFTRGNALILEIKNGDLKGAYMLPEELLETAFVQLYFLGEPDPEYFTLVMDRYPYGRLYKINKKEAGNAGAER